MGKLLKFALVPIAEVNWGSKLSATSKPAGSSVWSSFLTTFLITCIVSHLRHTVVQDAVEQAPMGKHAEGQFISATWAQSHFLDWACAIWPIHKDLLLHKPFVSWLLLLTPLNPLSIFTSMLSHVLLSTFGTTFFSMALPPLNILQVSVCASPGKPFLTPTFPCFSSYTFFLCVPCNTRNPAAALTLGFKCLHTCYAKDCKLLKGRDWIILTSCLAENL